MTLTQIVLQHNIEINNRDEHTEDEEDNANFVEISDEGANEGTFLFVIDMKSLC